MQDSWQQWRHATVLKPAIGMRVSLSSHPHTERKREREIEIEGEQGLNNLVASHLPWRLHHCALWIPVPSEEFQLYFWTQFALPKYFSIQLVFTCRRLRSLFSISLPLPLLFRCLSRSLPCLAACRLHERSPHNTHNFLAALCWALLG